MSLARVADRHVETEEIPVGVDEFELCLDEGPDLVGELQILRKDCLQPFEDLRIGPFCSVLQEVGPVLKIEVERALGDPSLLGDRLHRRSGQALLGDHPDRRRLDRPGSELLDDLLFRLVFGHALTEGSSV